GSGVHPPTTKVSVRQFLSLSRARLRRGRGHRPLPRAEIGGRRRTIPLAYGGGSQCREKGARRGTSLPRRPRGSCRPPARHSFSHKPPRHRRSMKRVLRSPPDSFAAHSPTQCRSPRLAIEVTAALRDARATELSRFWRKPNLTGGRRDSVHASVRAGR